MILDLLAGSNARRSRSGTQRLPLGCCSPFPLAFPPPAQPKPSALSLSLSSRGGISTGRQFRARFHPTSLPSGRRSVLGGVLPVSLIVVIIVIIKRCAASCFNVSTGHALSGGCVWWGGGGGGGGVTSAPHVGAGNKASRKVESQ